VGCKLITMNCDVLLFTAHIHSTNQGYSISLPLLLQSKGGDPMQPRSDKLSRRTALEDAKVLALTRVEVRCRTAEMLDTPLAPACATSRPSTLPFLLRRKPNFASKASLVL